MKFNELFEQGKYKDLIIEFEKLTPSDFRKELVTLVNDQQKKNVNIFEVLHDELTGKQWKLFRWLDSSNREKEYILNKAKHSTFTDNDDATLKSCDF